LEWNGQPHDAKDSLLVAQTDKKGLCSFVIVNAKAAAVALLGAAAAQRGEGVQGCCGALWWQG
jgi:hypothetical protein